MTRSPRWKAFSLWMPVVLYMGAIFIGSGTSTAPDLGVRVWDKAGHAAVYGGLGVVILRAFAGGLPAPVTARRAVGAALAATLYGLTDEWHQSYVPRRSADPLDLVADAVGASCAAAAVYIWCRVRHPCSYNSEAP